MGLPIYPLAARGGKKSFCKQHQSRRKVAPIFRRKAAAENEALSNLWHRNESSLAFSLSLSIVSLPILFSQLRRKRKRKRKRQRFLRLSFTFPSAMLDFRRKINFSSSRYAVRTSVPFGQEHRRRKRNGRKEQEGAYFPLESHSGGKSTKKEKRTNRAVGSYFLLLQAG